MKSAYNFAYHYNPEKYRRYESAARIAYYDVIAATCEHFEYNRYTFRLHTKHGMILCVVSEESEYFRLVGLSFPHGEELPTITINDFIGLSKCFL